jgi:hypothetical protein
MWFNNLVLNHKTDDQTYHRIEEKRSDKKRAVQL